TIVTVWAAFSGATLALPVAQHSGSNNPTSEGFGIREGNSPPSIIYPTHDSSTWAWAIQDTVQDVGVNGRLAYAIQMPNFGAARYDLLKRGFILDWGFKINQGPDTIVTPSAGSIHV